MPLDKKKQFFTKVLNLYSEGLNQKEIAFKIGLTEKTVGNWLKNVKQSEASNSERLVELENKLKELLQDKSSSTADIKNITIAIKQLESRWFNKLTKKIYENKKN